MSPVRSAVALVGAAVVGAAVSLFVAGLPAHAAEPSPAHFVLSGFGLRDGWTVTQHPRMLADITGDHRADIVGFGGAGVYTSIATGDGGFAPARFVLGEFGYDRGWRTAFDIPFTPRFVVDITGDGRADIVGVNASGTYTAISNGDGTFGAPVRQPIQFNCGPWLEAADVNGDQRTDLVCKQDHAVMVALSTGAGGFFAPYVATTEFARGDSPGGFFVTFVDVYGDRRAELLAYDAHTFVGRTARPGPNGTYNPSAINGLHNPVVPWIGDVDGDGALDQVGFTTVTQVQFGVGDGTFFGPVTAHSGFGSNDGWHSPLHMWFVADITGDRRVDIVGFGDMGVYTAASRGATFGPAQFAVNDLGANQGWRLNVHERYVVDITGDGRADVVGIGWAGVYTAVSVGDGTFR